jgi:hypothetical protein
MKRESAAVDAPYGMPKKHSTPPRPKPPIVPPEVLTWGEDGTAVCAGIDGMREERAPIPRAAIPLLTSLLVIIEETP